MSGKKHPNVPAYLNPSGGFCESFAMVPPDLFECEAFQKLSHAARLLYILLAVHATTYYQRSCLFQTMNEYNELFQLGLDGEALKLKVWGDKRIHVFSKLFVFPQKQFKRYGYSASRVYKLKRELIQAGFIREVYAGKGSKQKSFDKNVTVYEFSDHWKTISSVAEDSTSGL